MITASDLSDVHEVASILRLDHHCLCEGVQVENDQLGGVIFLVLNGAEDFIFVNDFTVSDVEPVKVRLHQVEELAFLGQNALEHSHRARHQNLLRLPNRFEWNDDSSPYRLYITKWLLNNINFISLEVDH